MQTAEANTTTTNTNHNINANNTLGDCARLLVAARLPLLLSSTEEMEEQPQEQLSFEELNAALRQRPLLAAADRLFPALVAAAEACHHHGALDEEEPPLECHTRKLFTACMIEAHPINVFEFPTEPLEAALSAATGPFLRTLGRLVVAVAESALWAEGVEQGDVGHEELEQQLLRQILLPHMGLLGELRPQMAAFEAAHAAWTAVDLPRLVRRISLALLGLSQARATAVVAAVVDNALVAHIDTSVARLRAQLARLDGGAAALAAIDAAAAVGDVLGGLHLPDLNHDNDADADDNNADA
jgi:hypothetical protein